ncbi:hypothetical protein BCF55_1668 [Hydrogenivirga caldilitoris]|uniref:Uncharacterized protein n=1 Tax=Hydrogenivirga caldilitoris TaxID=246264 RepID=A0A497XR28_9AQUI|nr:hypothetical protein [Hydrogenivirga caldilitoris]RLJ71368.1 hypothetical protein BCF55_1668 [Hydrogenivirga caldilitoris]
MGVRELIEVMRAEALNRMKEERKRRREQLKVKLSLLQKENQDKAPGLERKGGLL